MECAISANISRTLSNNFGSEVNKVQHVLINPLQVTNALKCIMCGIPTKPFGFCVSRGLGVLRIDLGKHHSPAVKSQPESRKVSVFIV